MVEMPLLSSYVPTSHVLPLYSTDPPSFHWNVSPFFSAWSAWDSSAVSAFFQTGIKRSAEAFSSSGKVSWTLSAFLPAESLTPTLSGISTLNQIKSVFLATGTFSLLSLLGALPPPDALPPQPTRANAAKRAMQRERIDRVFFFMLASSLSARDIVCRGSLGRRLRMRMMSLFTVRLFFHSSSGAVMSLPQHRAPYLYVCPSCRCPEVSKGGPCVPCLRCRRLSFVIEIRDGQVR